MNAAASLVYGDHRLLVINKPPGLSLATRRSDPDAAAGRLVSALPPDLRAAHGLEGERFRLVHRLDAGTTGLVLLARDETTHRQLATLLSARLIGKTYLALVWGHPRPRDGSIDSPLGPDRRDRRRMRIDPDGSPALTRYRTVGRARHVSLVELHPETGRTHQLRVHMAAAGNWIVGDDLYCGPRHRGVKDQSLRTVLDPPHLLLHAWRLALPESAGFVPCRFEAPLPPHFTAALDALHLSI